MAHAVDVHVGQRIRQLRRTLGISQSQLGSLIGVKSQQIQKYETGANRVSAHRLWDIATTTGTTISYFFKDIGTAEPEVPGGREPQAENSIEQQALDLVRTYCSISESKRRRLYELARALSSSD
jgi:transcriptional regulator with XRE-family HTH domain